MSLEVITRARDEEEAASTGSGGAKGSQAMTSKYPGGGTPEDPYVVDWHIGDPENPFNWSTRRKWIITLQVAVPIGNSLGTN